jgi:hypothetical protein
MERIGSCIRRVPTDGRGPSQTEEEAVLLI